MVSRTGLYASAVKDNFKCKNPQVSRDIKIFHWKSAKRFTVRSQWFPRAIRAKLIRNYFRSTFYYNDKKKKIRLKADSPNIDYLSLQSFRLKIRYDAVICSLVLFDPISKVSENRFVCELIPRYDNS